MKLVNVVLLTKYSFNIDLHTHMHVYIYIYIEWKNIVENALNIICWKEFRMERHRASKPDLRSSCAQAPWASTPCRRALVAEHALWIGNQAATAATFSPIWTGSHAPLCSAMLRFVAIGWSVSGPQSGHSRRAILGVSHELTSGWCTAIMATL